MTKIGDGASNTIFSANHRRRAVGAAAVLVLLDGCGRDGNSLNLPSRPNFTTSSRHTGVVLLHGRRLGQRPTLCNDNFTPPQPDINSQAWLNLQRLAGTNDGQQIDYRDLEF